MDNQNDENEEHNNNNESEEQNDDSNVMNMSDLEMAEVRNEEILEAANAIVRRVLIRHDENSEPSNNLHRRSVDLDEDNESDVEDIEVSIMISTSSIDSNRTERNNTNEEQNDPLNNDDDVEDQNVQTRTAFFSSFLSPSLLSSSRNRAESLFSPYCSFGGNTEEHKERDLILNTCCLCGDYAENPKVILHCKCVYHLRCFKLLENEEKCLGCEGIIFKTDDSDYDKCSVCLNLLKEKFTKTKCKHSFHVDCLRSWMLSQNNNRGRCPICRSEIN